MSYNNNHNSHYNQNGGNPYSQGPTAEAGYGYANTSQQVSRVARPSTAAAAAASGHREHSLETSWRLFFGLCVRTQC